MYVCMYKTICIYTHTVDYAFVNYVYFHDTDNPTWQGGEDSFSSRGVDSRKKPVAPHHHVLSQWRCSRHSFWLRPSCSERNEWLHGILVIHSTRCTWFEGPGFMPGFRARGQVFCNKKARCTSCCPTGLALHPEPPARRTPHGVPNWIVYHDTV